MYSPLSAWKVLSNAASSGTTNGLQLLLELNGGRLFAQTLATLLKLGFGATLFRIVASAEQADQATAFFRENFVITDPQAPGGTRYYQGRFLIRSARAEDNVSVLLRFCLQPEQLFLDTRFGEAINPLAVATTAVLESNEAEAIEAAPGAVDLVIRFKSVESVVGMMGSGDADIVHLLSENLVQVAGHIGHLLKLGSIGTNVQNALRQP
jgi:hypothetical protein